MVSTYVFPFKEDICRFDFEVDSEDEYMFDFAAMYSKNSSK